jgi:3-oxoadipate enol-lactonase
VTEAGTTVLKPWLPDGAPLELPGRGTTFVRSIDGPPGAPTIVLLHGWTATADLNFFACYRELGAHYRVVALDHRGHGRGIRSRKAFRLEDCADDAVAMCDELGIERMIPVGYSMGGPVAQLIAHRHEERVSGMVLCATSDHFSSSRQERLNFLGLGGLAALARLTPAQARTWLTRQFYLQRKAQDWDPWAIEEVAASDWRAVLEAGKAIGQFSSRTWIDTIDVPTSVVLTMRDSIIPLRRQLRMLQHVPGAVGFRVDADHDAVVNHADRFVPVLLEAIESVVERSR